MKYIMLFILAICLNGCELFVEKPNNAAAFTSDQIVALAIQVDQAQSAGQLSEAKGDYYIERLIQANALLGGTLDVFTHLKECSESTTKFQCIDAIMLTVMEDL